MKKNIIYVAIFLIALSTTGCETFKGAATGAKKDATHLYQAFDGVPNGDGTKRPSSLLKADKWIEEHLW